MSLIGGLVDYIIEPSVALCIEEQGGVAFAGLKQEVRSRFADLLGTPGNHDIERSIRLAQLQAMSVALRHYTELVEVTRKLGEPIDPPDLTDPFLKSAKRALANELRRRVTVSVGGDFVTRVRAEVAQDIARSARGETGTERGALELVETEFRAAAGVESLPPGFVSLLREGRDPLPAWLGIYGAFLCEELKLNPRFQSILMIELLDKLRAQGEAAGLNQARITQAMREAVDRQNAATGAIGLALARIEATLGAARTAIDPDTLADVVATELSGSVERLDAVYGEVSLRARAAEQLRDTMFRDAPEQSPERMTDTLDAFRYVYAVDPFVGRGDRLATIESRLLEADGEADRLPAFRWMALCGEGGVGKSRLAQQLVARNRRTWAHAGFATDTHVARPEAIFEIGQRLTAPALIIVDYAVASGANLPEFIKRWRDYAVSDGAHPVRIVVITRREKDLVLEEIRGRGISPMADMEGVKNAELSLSPMVLGPLTDDETLQLMRSRMALTARKLGMRLREMTDDGLRDALVGFDHRRRPLFAAMVASALQRDALPQATSGEEDNRLTLFAEHLRHQFDRHWRPRALKIEHPTLAQTSVWRHANIVRLSTCCGGLELSRLRAVLPPDVVAAGGRFPALTATETPGSLRDEILYAMTGETVREQGSDDGDAEFMRAVASGIVPTLEPDLLGELFLLATEDELAANSPWAKARPLAALAWRFAPDRTAVFLRLAAQDYPQRTHGLRWLPPSTDDARPEVLRARARMLRNVCSDIATRCGRSMPSAVQLTRLFDIVAEFDGLLSDFALSDPETQEHYGQVLRQVANMGARLGNASLHFIDPITAIDDKAPVPTDALRKAFNQFELEAASSQTLESAFDIAALPEELAAIIVAHLPRIARLAEPFLFRPEPYAKRRPFERALRDVVGSVHFRYRTDRARGGRWPIEQTEEAAAEVLRLLKESHRLAGGTIDDLAVMSGLVTALLYADHEISGENVGVPLEEIASVLRQADTIPSLAAQCIASMLVNLLIIKSETLSEDQVAHIHGCALIFELLLNKVDTADLDTQQRASAVVSSFCRTADLLGRRGVTPDFPSLLRGLSRLLDRLPDSAQVSPSLLLLVAQRPKGFDPAALDPIYPFLARQIDRRAINVDLFRSSPRELFDALRQLVFGWPDPDLMLPQELRWALVMALDETVGAIATRGMLVAISTSLGPPSHMFDADNRALARRFILHARNQHGFDGSDLIAAAMMTLWGQMILAGELEAVKIEIDTLWSPESAPSDRRGHAIAVWGAALAIDATRKPDGFTRRWSAWLRDARRLSTEAEDDDLQRRGLTGVNGADAEDFIRHYNFALIDACQSAARLHVLSGGDPSDWIEEKNR